MRSPRLTAMTDSYFDHIRAPTSAAIAVTSSRGTCMHRLAIEASDHPMMSITAGNSTFRTKLVLTPPMAVSLTRR